MNSPLGIIIGAFLFGILRSGGDMMEMIARVPIAVIYIIQGLVIIFVIAGQMVNFEKKAILSIHLRSASAGDATGESLEEPSRVNHV